MDTIRCPSCRTHKHPTAFEVWIRGPRKGKYRTSCAQCIQDKEAARAVYALWRSRGCKDGFNWECELSRQRRLLGLSSPPETHENREVELKEYLKVAISASKSRAAAKGVPHRLTLNNIPSIPDTCPVLGIPLYPSKGKATDNSPSLDRIDPALGYVPGNVAWISNRANRIKNDATADELASVTKWLRSQTDTPPAISA